AIPALCMQLAWGGSMIGGLSIPQQASNTPPSTSTSLASLPSPTPSGQVQGAQSAHPTAKVLQAVSGDTLDVDLDNQPVRIKLIGLQAPAMPDKTTGKAECFGPEAQMFLDSLLRGRTVELVVDQLIGEQTDKSELSRYVIMDDGTKVNQL